MTAAISHLDVVLGRTAIRGANDAGVLSRSESSAQRVSITVRRRHSALKSFCEMASAANNSSGDRRSLLRRRRARSPFVCWPERMGEWKGGLNEVAQRELLNAGDTNIGLTAIFLVSIIERESGVGCRRTESMKNMNGETGRDVWSANPRRVSAARDIVGPLTRSRRRVKCPKIFCTRRDHPIDRTRVLGAT